MLSEISQSQKDKCCIILLLGSIQHKLIGTESRMVVGCQELKPKKKKRRNKVNKEIKNKMNVKFITTSLFMPSSSLR